MTTTTSRTVSTYHSLETQGKYVNGFSIGTNAKTSMRFGTCKVNLSMNDVGPFVVAIKNLIKMEKDEFAAVSVHFWINGSPAICSKFFKSEHTDYDRYSLCLGAVRIDLSTDELLELIQELNQIRTVSSAHFEGHQSNTPSNELESERSLYTVKGCPACHKEPIITARGHIVCNNDNHPADQPIATYGDTVEESVEGWNADNWEMLGASREKLTSRPTYEIAHVKNPLKSTSDSVKVQH
jgi:hypothetical protein